MKLRHAILGLLSIEPQSGYDLNRAFASSVAHFWYADQSQIYRTLDVLQTDGAITAKTIKQEGRPDRRVHSLTPRGETELKEWSASPLEFSRIKDPFLARLFFAAPLGEEKISEMLTEAEQAAQETLERLQSIDMPQGDLGAILRAATLRSGILETEAALTWLAELHQALKNSGTNPPS